MDEVARREIEADISKLLVRYCRAFDEGRFEEVAALFSTDATWKRPGMEVMRGAAEIRAHCNETAPDVRFRHLLTNILVNVTGNTHATAVSSFLLFVAPAPENDGPAPVHGPAIVGDYHDQLIKLQDGWRLSHREARYVFKNG